MARDLAHNVKCSAGWAGATIGSDTDTDSPIVIDSQGFGSIAFAVYSGAIGAGTYVLKIVETDNADGSTGAAEVGAYHVQDSFGASDDNVVKKVGAPLTKRYCKLRITSTSATSGVFKGAVAMQGHVIVAPVA